MNRTLGIIALLGLVVAHTALAQTVPLCFANKGLKVERYGRNHVTQAWGAYIADYEPCTPDHATLMRAAKRIGFARGVSSASVAVTLEAATARKAFVLNLGNGQGASVDAPGCGISFYYPDKKRHDETAIDRLHIAALPQGGDYVFVLLPAGAPGRCDATFSAR